MPVPFNFTSLRDVLYRFPTLVSSCATNTTFLPPFDPSFRRKVHGGDRKPTATSRPGIPGLVKNLQEAFDTGKTLPIEWRRRQLQQLWTLIDENEAALREAIFKDIGKSKLEAQVYELGGLKNEILHMLQNFEDWLRPEIPTIPEMFQSYNPTIHREPKGVVLIIAPWNYPIVLLLLPLLGAIAAGNAVILKPSELAPAVTARLAELIPKYLDRDCFRVLQGGKDVVEELLSHPLGHIFFTGSTPVGKCIMAAASKHLTPVTLELGGKSPAIVTDSANIAQAAKRIAWGKFLNAGQTCVAPDYALVQESILPQFLDELTKVLKSRYPHDPEQPAQYGRILNAHHFKRLTSLLASTHGKPLRPTISASPSALSIPPTVITNLHPTDPLLQPPEIFGPILPILSFPSLSSLPGIVAQIDPTPLATYIFSLHPPATDHLTHLIPSGATCINDVLGHLGVTGLPVSGRGSSGMGSYRGRESVECFSARRTVVSVPTCQEWEDGALGWRYPGGMAEEDKFAGWKAMEGKRDW
ncbi:MAG: hypothetical protein L6R40_006933 [Gallowayella cf. fulva]|nr:MAG: hypothetical protein L6R40_006933 [Xanthomendoza cf. fulva]